MLYNTLRQAQQFDSSELYKMDAIISLTMHWLIILEILQKWNATVEFLKSVDYYIQQNIVFLFDKLHCLTSNF